MHLDGSATPRTLGAICLAGFLAACLSACQTGAAQQMRSDIKALPDVLRTGVHDAKDAAAAVKAGAQPAGQTAN